MYDNLWLILTVLIASFLTSQVSAKSFDEFTSETETLRRVKRIVNGETVRNGQWPWLVHLKADAGGRTYHCGGSIIAPRWILTAAHCMDGHAKLLESKVWHVTAGEIEWECDNWFVHSWFRLIGKTSERCHIHATRVIRHPDYKAGQENYWLNDIALLYLEDNILSKENTDTIAPCDTSGVNGEFPTEGDTGYVHGWGCTSVGGDGSPSAQGAEINIRRSSDCKAVFRARYNTDSHICAGGYGESVCNGDSGGPLVVNDLSGRYCQAGVVSFFVENQATTRPSGFARVSASRNWINEVIRRG